MTVRLLALISTSIDKRYNVTGKLESSNISIWNKVQMVESLNAIVVNDNDY